MADHINVQKCLEDKGLDFNYYVGVTRHLQETLLQDKIIDEPRFEEDIRKLLEIFCICGDESKNKWCDTKEYLGKFKVRD